MAYDIAAILKQAGIGSNFYDQTNYGHNTASIDDLFKTITQLPDDSAERQGLLDSGFGLPDSKFGLELAQKVRSGADLGDLRQQLIDRYGAGGTAQHYYIDPETMQTKRVYLGSNGKLLGVSTASAKDKWYQSAIKIGVPLGLAAITGNVGAAAAGGAGTLAGAAAGGATAGGVQAATTGGDIGKGILMGGALGGLGAGVKNLVSPALTDALGTAGGKIATGAVQGGVGAAVKGGNILQGALQGGINSGIKLGTGSLMNTLMPSDGGDHGFIDQRDDPLLTGGTPSTTGGGKMDFDFSSLIDQEADLPQNSAPIGANWWENISLPQMNFDGSFVDQEADLPTANDPTGNWFEGLGGTVGGIASGLGGALSSGASSLLKLIQSNPQLATQLGATGIAALVAGKPGKVDPRVSEAINSIKGIAGQQLTMANDSYAKQKALLGEFSPILRQQLQLALADQTKASARGDDIWSSFATNFMPNLNKLASTALNYDTPERRMAAQQEAEGIVASNFQNQREQLNQSQMGMNIDPAANAANEAALRIAEARARAGAGTTARTGVEERGIQLVDNASRVGLQLPGLSAQQTAIAAGQGQTAQNTVRNIADMTAAPETIAAPLFRDAINGATTTANAGISLTGANNGVYNAKAGLVGDLLGAGLNAYGYYGTKAKVPTAGVPS